MGVTEPFKRWRRSVDFHPISFVDKCFRWYGRLTTTYRRILLFLVFICICSVYWTPTFLNFHSKGPIPIEELLQKCIDDHVHGLYYKKGYLDEFVFFKDEDWSETTFSNENKYSPMVGNGAFGVSFHPIPTLYLKDSRTLSLNTQWNPLQPFYAGGVERQYFYTNVQEGTVTQHQCVSSGLRVASTYSAHRTNPNLFYRDIMFYNPTDLAIQVEFEKMDFPEWFSLHISDKRTDGFLSEKPLTFSGIVKNISNHQSIVACVSMKGMTQSIKVPAHRNKHFTFPLIIHHETVNLEPNSRLPVTFGQKCINHMENFMKIGHLEHEQEHSAAWRKLWNTGLTISHSKASGALNTHQINATVYYVLSSISMNKTRKNTQFAKISNYSSYLSDAEGCYGGYHHTLQANKLWTELNTFKTITDCVDLWLLTLEKQGCHKLLGNGAEGVVQAMILSFGGFRFSPHHLEFKIEPKFLHRDYYFRNIKVDDNIYINVSVILQENNKAILAVNIDKVEKQYWACDGGCIDEPVKLSPTNSVFPVKITDPITSILYITPDRKHMELIKDTLHVHKIVEAPAHDNHVVALHKHGSHLGGLPIMFWATVITLIVIFHLFLCKLIYNEYFGKQDKTRNRYSRVPSGRGI